MVAIFITSSNGGPVNRTAQATPKGTVNLAAINKALGLAPNSKVLKKLASAAAKLVANQNKWQLNQNKITKLKQDVDSVEDDIEANQDDIEDLEEKKINAYAI